MPVLSTVVLSDAANPIVNHSFVPNSSTNGKTQWVNPMASTLRGREILTIELKKPSTPTGAQRVHVTLGSPVETTVDGVTAVRYVNSSEIWFNWSSDGTKQSRLDHIAKIRDLLGEAVFLEAAADFVTFY